MVEEKNEQIDPKKLIDTTKKLHSSGYITLLTITAVDQIKNIKLIYRFADLMKNKFINVVISLDEKGEIESLYEVFKSADWLEREVYDLFGVKFLNHPNLKRILTEESDFPLLKNYSQKEA